MAEDNTNNIEQEEEVINKQEEISEKKTMLIRDSSPLQFKISSTGYQNLMLPNFSTNYIMFMMDIDYPDKAKENPNGSLFMKPSKQILEDADADIGLKCFGGELDWSNIYNFKTREVDESYDYIKYLNNVYSNNTAFNSLFELLGGIGTDDLNNHVLGSNINQHTADREKMRRHEAFKGSPIDAIDMYITESIVVVENLARAIAGDNVKDLHTLGKVISNLNTATDRNIVEYLEKNNEVLKQLSDNTWQKSAKEQKAVAVIFQKITRIQMFQKDDKSNWSEYAKTPGGKSFNDWLVSCMKEGNEDKWEAQVNQQLLKLKVNFGKGLKVFKDNNILSDIDFDTITEIKFSDPVSGSVSDSVKYNYNKSLTEDVDEEAGRALESFDFDGIYNSVRSTVRDVMLGICINDYTKWQITTNAKTRMEKLKEAADKEIQAKIELICRTASNGQSSLGDKFKAAISKHPMRAEGLKNIWARYSDDLTDRIETRLRSIGGQNGDTSIFTTIKQFLLSTYPNLIALMFTWKCVLMLCRRYYNKYPIPEISGEQLEANTEKVMEQYRNTILRFYTDPVENNTEETTSEN